MQIFLTLPFFWPGIELTQFSSAATKLIRMKKNSYFDLIFHCTKFPVLSIKLISSIPKWGQQMFSTQILKKTLIFLWKNWNTILFVMPENINGGKYKQLGLVNWLRSNLEQCLLTNVWIALYKRDSNPEISKSPISF